MLFRSGQGKTNLVEAVDYLSRLSSHRVATDAPLIRAGADQAIIRAAVVREGRTAVLEGFAGLTRDLTVEGDLYALIRRAQQFAQQLLPSGFAVYYEPEGDLWRLKSQVGDLGNPELQATLDAGISFEGTSNLLIPWQSRRPYYQEQYDHAADGLGTIQGAHIAAHDLDVIDLFDRDLIERGG